MNGHRRVDEQHKIGEDQRWRSVQIFFWAALFTGVIVALIYLYTLHDPFMFDGAVTLRDPAAVGRLATQPLSRILWRPRGLVDASFAVTARGVGANPAWWRAGNLLLHWLNSLLVFALVAFFVTVLPERAAERRKPGWAVLPWFCAGLFAAHPLQTESVTYIYQRYTCMAAFFYLAATLAWCWAWKWRSAGKKAAYAAILTLFLAILACWSKQNAFTLPLALIVVTLTLSPTFSGRDLIRFIVARRIFFLVFAFLLLSGGLWLIFSHGYDLDAATRETTEIGRWAYLRTELVALLVYGRLFLLPYGQNLDHAFSLQQPVWVSWVGALAVSGIIAGAWAGRRRFPLIALGGGWFLVTLSLESSIFPLRDALAEHRLYLPLFGLCLASGAMLVRLTGGRQRRMIAISSVLLLGYGSLAIARNRVWTSPLRMWKNAVAGAPKNSRAWDNLSVARREAGDLNGALQAAEQALRLRPDDASALEHCGVILAELGKHQAARLAFAQSVKSAPERASAWRNYGAELSEQQQVKAAASAFSKAVELDPQDGLAYLGLGQMRMRLGNNRGAVQSLRRARRLRPDDARVSIQLAIAWQQLGKNQRAEICFSRAVIRFPNNAALAAQYGIFLLARRQFAPAIRFFRRAVKLEPGTGVFYRLLGSTLLKLGPPRDASGEQRLQEAADCFSRATDLTPKDEHAWFNWGILLMNQGKYSTAAEKFNRTCILNPRNTKAWYYQARCLAAVPGRKKEARTAVLQALKLMPDDPPARQLAQQLAVPPPGH